MRNYIIILFLKETKIDEDEMLSEILGEINDTPSSSIKPKTIMSEYSSMSRKLAAKDYMKSFTPPKRKIAIKKSSVSYKMTNAPSENKAFVSKSVLREVQNNGDNNMMEDIEIAETPSEDNLEIEEFDSQRNTQITNGHVTETAESQMSDNLTIETDQTQDCLNGFEGFDDDDNFDMSQIDEIESQQADTTVDEEKITNELQAEFMSEWENLTNENTDMEIDHLDKTDIPLSDVDGKKVGFFLCYF